MRIRTICFSLLWGLFSLSYFESINNKVFDNKSQAFDIALSGAIEITGCLIAGHLLLNERRV